MREDMKRSFRGKIVINIAIGAVISLIVSFVLIYNMGAISDALMWIGGKDGLINPSNVQQVAMGLITAVGIGVFVLVFFLFQYNQSAYVKDISNAMKRISGGDLSVKVPVLGDDELSYMAAALNALTEDLRMLIERERASEKSKNELITNVAHDLRTPLTSILGYLELLCADTKKLDDDVRLQYTTIARDKAKRLQQLIEELFGLTKMSYGRMAVHLSKIDIAKLMEQMIDEFYPVFEDKKLECIYHSDVNSLIIDADGDLIARLFENLINNATKYGADGKQLRVNVRYGGGEYVTIAVTNFGHIIPEKELPFIFDKFYRVEQSRATTTGGTGLGLAIVKTIVDLHGGSIEVESDLENGTTFTVRLRLHITEEEQLFFQGEHNDELGNLPAAES